MVQTLHFCKKKNAPFLFWNSKNFEKFKIRKFGYGEKVIWMSSLLMRPQTRPNSICTCGMTVKCQKDVL